MNHVVVISDVHLCEAVPAGDDLWMRYRQRRFFPDEDFARLFDLLVAEAGAGRLTLVFNGDMFDFDAPAVIDGEVRFEDTPRTEPVAVAALTRILDDHDVFVDAVGRVVAAGHRVVFVSGNHDAQLAFPAVRALLAGRVLEAAHRHAGERTSREGLAARVEFRTWFLRTEEGVHVEHGNQYDAYCSFRYAMEPFTPDGLAVQPTMGSLSFRHLIARMGYFNPHVDSSFMLSLPGYLAHWARYYLFSKRSLATAWCVGAVRVFGAVIRHRTGGDPTRAARNVAQAAAETGVDPAAVSRHAALCVAPSEDNPHSVARELWLDRFAFLTLGAGALAAASFAGPVAVAALAVGGVGSVLAYEAATPKPPLDATYHLVARRARDIARIYGARAVVFGHTHQPFGRWEDGVFYGNSGTWSAAFTDVECTQPVDEGRPVIWLRSDERTGRLEGGLYTWRGGMLIEAREGGRAIESGADAVRPSLAPTG